MENKGSNFDKRTMRSNCEKESTRSESHDKRIKSDSYEENTCRERNKERISSESIESDCDENYDSRIWKNKSKVEDDYDLGLILSIFYADGIDNQQMDSTVIHSNRIYKVESWVDIGALFVTDDVYGSPDPEWNQEFYILLENPMDCRFVHLEVIRTHSKIDPGTSTGEVMVGKVQLPLPELFTRIEGSFELVRPDGPGCKAEGYITVAMELTKILK